MSDEASLDELVSVWQRESAGGRDLSAAALCPGQPELADELQRRIDAVRRLGALARGDDTAVPAAPPTAPAALPAASLLDALRQNRLLDAAQLRELEGQAGCFADGKALAGELIRRGWLTPYQANQLLQGRGRELLLGSYVLLERLGEGGMGQVFKARHWKLGRVVALKLIRPERLAHPDAVRRFRREVQAAAALSHPNIVHAYDADEIAGTHLLVMECVEGATDLARLVKQTGPLPVERACEYVRQAALGLQHACARGMVHRDVKPQNMLLTADGRTVKLLDMGLARLDHPDSDGDRTSTMTQEGAIMGTPDYIAPEQVMGSHGVDIRADLYSLGCTFYNLLTGRVPFPGGTLMQKLDGHRFKEPAPVESLRPDVPAGVAAVVRKLMAKRPEDRYQAPAEVAAALAALTRPEGETAPSLGGGGTVMEGRAAGASGDTLADPFAGLDRGATAIVVAPSAGPGAGRRRWLLPAVAGGSLAAACLVALLLVLLHKGAEQPPEKVADGPADTGAPSPKEPKQVDDAWLKKVAGLPAENQVAVVVAKLKELSPGFDGKETHKIENGIVIELGFLSDNVTDISPVKALAGLKALVCAGDNYDKGRLADLSPLKGMKLTSLDCLYNKQLSDLSPLEGMPLIELACGHSQVSDLSPLKGMKLTGLHCGATKVSDLSPLEGMPLTYLSCGELQASDLSPLRGMPLLHLECGGTQVSDLSPLAGMKLVFLQCAWTKIADLSPLKGMPLGALEFHHTPVGDLSPLKGMPLTRLYFSNTAVADLSPLKGLPVTDLDFSATPVSDLSPLKGMPLTGLNCSAERVKDLSPLKGMPLTKLICNGTKVFDLSPLKGMQLAGLYCNNTLVSDLSPLKGMPLGDLDCQGTPVSNLSPLKGMPLITSFACDFKPERDSEILRSITTLKIINGKPAGEFWKEVEATKP